MIYIKLTNGFGNNLFQYNAARLLAEYHNTKVFGIPPAPDYYGIKSLEKLGLRFESFNIDNAILIDGNQQFIKAFDQKYSNKDMILSGYFEDYRFFLPAREKIKS